MLVGVLESLSKDCRVASGLVAFVYHFSAENYVVVRRIINPCLKSTK